MTFNQLVFVDFSSIANPIWHTTGNDPNPDAMSIAIVAKVRALTSGQPHAALCLDSPQSFRREMEPTYKAGRDSKPASFFHQCQLALDILRGDGFPQWKALGFEADDIVASAVARAGKWPCLIISADKDLLQLVTEHVQVKSLTSGDVFGPAGVQEKFGVAPHQIMDWLTLVGDKADNVTGVKGIGAVGATQLLTTFGNLDDLYAAMAQPDSTVAIKPAQFKALVDFKERLPLVRTLLSLRTDASIPFDEVLTERVPLDVATGAVDEIMQDINEAMPTTAEINWGSEDHRKVTVGVGANLRAQAAAEAAADLGPFVEDVARRVAPPPPTPPVPAPPSGATTLVPSVPNGGEIGTPSSVALTPVVVDFERELEPRSMNQAVQLANLMHRARLFSAYGSPEAVLSTILAGRELGLAAMASLRAFNVIEGKSAMAADAMRALVLKSGKAKSFRCTERTATAATFKTERVGDGEPMELRYTIEEATIAGLVKDKSGWMRNPADMLVARASSKLARLVYPDVVAGLYAPEEF